MANKILVDRLVEMYNPWKVFTCTHEDVADYLQSKTFLEPHMNNTFKYDVKCIAFFVEEFRRGRRTDPIEIDNVCSRGFVYPLPTLLDGHHRLSGATIANNKWIQCSYGGRIDLLRYLQGRRKTPPSY